MRALLALALLLSTPALAVAPAGSVRAAGHFGIGVGGGTAVAGFSGKYFLSDATALQFVLGGAGYGHHDYDHDDYGDSALGVNVDFLWELPALAEVGGAFELGWAVGLGGWAWIGEPTWVGAKGVLGLEFNLVPAPIDLVLEYQPSLRVVPELGFEAWDFGAHLRFYFG